MNYDLSLERDENNEATYCPEDNKLRIYISGDGRVSREAYLRLRKIGFKSTPKQSCSFVATWSIPAENACLDLIGEADDIGDEDISPAQRALDRAERFAGYRDKRLSEARSHADVFESGPSVFGHQNLARAERAAKRHERHRDRAVTQWSKAEYWQSRTKGVIDSAIYKSEPAVRRSRILRLEAEQRSHEATVANSVKRWTAWLTVRDTDDEGKAEELAHKLAHNSYWSEYTHPHTGEKLSLYSMVFAEENPITPKEAAAIALASYPEGGPNAKGSASQRVSDHYRFRLAYEREMLEAQGGSASNAEIELGGFFGSYQVYGVNKSPVTKLVTSVKLLAPEPYWRGEGEAPLTLQSFNIQRFGESDYRPPTDEEREAFTVKLAELKRKQKAAAPKKPALINPTREEAEKLQAILNSQWEESKGGEVEEMTQAVYSKNSKGTYAKCETSEITELLEIYKPSYYGGTNQPHQTPVFKVRMHRRNVIVLTDKPQKAIPFDRCEEIEQSWPSREELVEKLGWFAEVRSRVETKDELSEEESEFFNALCYRGLGYSRAVYQWGFTKEADKILSEQTAEVS